MKLKAYVMGIIPAILVMLILRYVFNAESGAAGISVAFTIGYVNALIDQ